MQTPSDFGQQIQKNWYVIVNEELTLLREKIEQKSPVYKGNLRQGWLQQKATPLNGQGSLETHVPYFPHIEAGLPKGYGVESNERDRLLAWVEAKMNVRGTNASHIVGGIVQRYFREGREGRSYVGAAPAKVPSKLGEFPKEPIRGGLIDQTFERIRRRTAV
jgi:hypothetical protein